MKAPKKPQRTVIHEPAYDWSEVSQYIEKIEGRSLTDWAGKHRKHGEGLPYQNFWHWMCDNMDVHRDSYFTLNLDDDWIDDSDEEHLFVREVFAVLRREFPEAEGEMYCWIY